MAVGFAKDGAEQDEINAVIQAAVNHARKQINAQIESLIHCRDCGDIIPEKRRQAVKGCKYCITCQEDHDSTFKRPPRNCWHRSMR
ncbi:TPA: TraR/DksA C4-type zinc finger protein [Escherichia coli]|nr:TraR/DksA C4-type zinc finger protein [Escherichia coli]